MAESSSDGHLSIGEVLGVLVEEFPDVTISKIRFLESQGLIAPERTPSGYRKFYSDDVDLLRVILTEQRENYLPLRVIKDRLDSGEIDPTGEHLRPSDADMPDEDYGDDEHRTSNGVVDTSAATTPNSATAEVRPVAPSSAPSGGGDSTAPIERPAAPPVAETAATPSGFASRPAPSADEHAKVRAIGDARAVGQADAAQTGAHQATEPSAPKQSGSQPAGSTAPEADDAASEVPGESVASHPAARGGARRDQTEASSPRLLPGVMLDAGELCGMVGITRAELEELESFGIVVGREVIGGRVYTEDAVAIAKPAAALLRAGVDSRHLRAWRTAAEREASLYEQLITPRLRQRNPEARSEAMAQLRELEATGDALHDAMVRAALRPHFES